MKNPEGRPTMKERKVPKNVTPLQSATKPLKEELQPHQGIFKDNPDENPGAKPSNPPSPDDDFIQRWKKQLWNF
jgi:hypothetical protein